MVVWFIFVFFSSFSCRFFLGTNWSTGRDAHSRLRNPFSFNFPKFRTLIWTWMCQKVISDIRYIITLRFTDFTTSLSHVRIYGHKLSPPLPGTVGSRQTRCYLHCRWFNWYWITETRETRFLRIFFYFIVTRLSYSGLRRLLRSKRLPKHN